MTLIRLVRLLQDLSRNHKKKVFTLKEIAALGHESPPSAAMTLLRAAEKGLVARVGNLWLNLTDPPDLLEVALSLASPSYLSFESALYRHGLLSQAPRGAFTIATTGRSRLLQTPFGSIQLIHLKSPLFFGFDDRRIAFPEKAWLDLLYIRGRQGRKQLLSEEFYPEGLDKRRLKKMARKFPVWLR